ncbi:MAG: hypothetical protein PF508_18900 [Spirochaeta sp.]|jgi:spermidine synthase|nr:hypothetical protein [Spirochaeta sp.]
MEQSEHNVTVRNRAGVLVALFVMSAASLALEVSVTRLFSFLFVQSYVYILVSLSMAGLGTGAVISYFLVGASARRITAIATSIPAVLLLFLFITNTLDTLLGLSLVFTFGIFVTIGIYQVLIFRESGVSVGHLYAADLLGASAGSVIAFVTLNAAGAIGALVIMVVTIGLSFVIIRHVLFGSDTRKALPVAVIIVAALVTAWLPLTERMLPDEGWAKEMTLMLDDPEVDASILETRWSAFGRVDLVETENALFRTMFIDGAAGTKLVQMEDGRVSRDVAQTLLFQYMGGIPLLTMGPERRQDAAVIGSGGGIDVATLLAAGFDAIDAIEINPDFIDIVREMPEYTGGIYNDHPQVTVHETEGRSFLRTTERRYDLILMGLPIIKSVRNFGNHALTENYLFTTEAFGEYRRALKPGGMVVLIAHYPNELFKLVTNAINSFKSDGLTSEEAMERIVTVGPNSNPTLILKNESFTRQEREDFATLLTNLPITGTTNFVPGFSADLSSRLGFNAGLTAISRGELTVGEFVDGAREDIGPIDDNSPFFYQMDRTLPAELKTVGTVIAIVLLVVTLVFVLRTVRKTPQEERRGALLLYVAFMLIGVGFIVVEIAVLQRFIVFWKHQTLALAVVLAAILVAGGLGSLLSTRIRRPTHAALVAIVIAVGTAVLMWILTPVLRSFESAGLPTKIAITFVCVVPLFVPMGIPFPYLLRQATRRLYPWMMGINSFTTLTGSVLAIIVAMGMGYSTVAIIGATAYLLLAILLLGAWKARIIDS